MRRRHFFETMGFGSLATIMPFSRPEVFPRETPQERETGSMDPRIKINLENIAWNVEQIQKLVKVPIMAVVKANAYGHGLVEVSQFLEKRGIRWLMVGKLDEAVSLRQNGIKSSILSFGPFSEEDAKSIIGWDISQSVYTEEDFFLSEQAAKLDRKARVHLDLDTGMGRTGIPCDKALPLIERLASLPNIKIEGVSTTLTEDKEFDREQIRSFLDVCSRAAHKGIALGLKHAASSAGILADAQFNLDMVRPGIMVYGYYPSSQTQKEDRLSLRPALRLLGRVINITDLEPGDSLSYHRAFVAPQKMRAATLGIGYSDGYPPALGGKASVLIRNKKFQTIPAITANHLMVDLKDEEEVRIGDEAVLIDTDKASGLTADILAELAGISVYKLIIGLNPLLPRTEMK